MVTDEMQDTVEEASGMSETLGENVCDDGQDEYVEGFGEDDLAGMGVFSHVSTTHIPEEEREAIRAELNGEVYTYAEPMPRFKCPKGIWISGVATLAGVAILVIFMVISIKNYRGTTEWEYHARMSDSHSLTSTVLDSLHGTESVVDGELSDTMKYVTDAYNKADEGYPYAAILDLDNHLQEHPEGYIMAVAAMDITMEHRDYANASYFYANYLIEKSVNDKVYDRVVAYIDELDTYWNITNAVDEEWDAFYEKAGDSDSYDEAIAAIVDRLKGLEGNPEVNQAVLYYYLGDYSSNEEEAIGYYKKSFELDSKMCYPASVVAVDMRNKGEYDEAEKMLLELCDWDKENAYTSRVLASIYLLENRNEEALSYAKRAYDNFAEGNYVAETYAIALHANGMQDECRSICDEIEKKEYYASEEFMPVIDGKMSIEEYYSK